MYSQMSYKNGSFIAVC